jgi:hypothetical protein
MGTSYTDKVTEEELIERAKRLGNNARVSLDDVNKEIASEHYYNPGELHPLTICVLKLANGFLVTGTSAPAIEANFDETIGRRLAREKCIDQIWQLMGYALRLKTYENNAKLAEAKVPRQDGFETYIGTKVIHAQPCTRFAYLELRQWKIPDNEDGNDEGYLIEYADRVENMFPGFQGYISWSPKDVFESAYRKVAYSA